MKFDLVFEGGGAKGMVFVGACEEFLSHGNTYGRLLGTSAGAITATLLAAGYTPQEMLNALNEREAGKSVFTGFMGDPPPFTKEEVAVSAIRKLLRDVNLKFVPDLIEEKMDDVIAKMLAKTPNTRHFFAFVERGGWFAADRFIAWLQAKLDSGFYQEKQRNFSSLTLKQFFDVTKVDLSMVVSDTTDGRLLVLNHLTAPDCPVVWSVRMSMSIPLVWDEVIWKKKWGSYRGQTLEDHVIVDGGILSNFPIELFISDEPQVTKLMGPKQGIPVLGLLIDESIPVPVPAKRGILVDINVKPQELATVRRFMRLVNTMTGAHDKMVIEEFEELVVRLPAAGYGTTEFDMSDDRRNALVAAGRNAMKDYLDHHAAPHALRMTVKATKTAKTSADRTALKILNL